MTHNTYLCQASTARCCGQTTARAPLLLLLPPQGVAAPGWRAAVASGRRVVYSMHAACCTVVIMVVLLLLHEHLLWLLLQRCTRYVYGWGKVQAAEEHRHRIAMMGSAAWIAAYLEFVIQCYGGGGWLR